MLCTSTLDTDWTPVRMMERRLRPYLVIVRTGNNSLHRAWTKNLPPDTDRTWDLLLSHHADGEQDCPDADIVVRQKAFKHPACHRLYQDLPWLHDYRAVWLCDDDIATDWANVNRMFAVMEEFGLDLAQPALSPDSCVSHALTVAQPEFLLRYTSFVEAMAPVFSARAIRTCLPSFPQNISGWGLDCVWPHLLGQPRNTIAVLDAAPVRHTRPVGEKPIYVNEEFPAIDRYAELNAYLAAHGIAFPPLIEYGFILSKPHAPGTPLPRAARCESCERMNVALPTLVAPPPDSVWARLPEGWKAPAAWTGGLPSMFDIPPMAAHDHAMSFGLSVAIGGATPADGGEVMLIGGEGEYPRARFSADMTQNGWRPVIRIYTRAGNNAAIVGPECPRGRTMRFMLHMVPAAGILRLFIDGKPLNDAKMPAWTWPGATRVMLGSPALKASIEHAWVAAGLVTPTALASVAA